MSLYLRRKSPYEHYLVFKELLQDKSNKINWHSQILYFSEEFIKEVKHNEKWLKLKLYFSESLRKKLTRSTYDASCNDLFLSAKKINRFRPTPFIMEFYPLEFLEGQGAVYIDHTHTCYPLILYPQAHKVKTSTRIDGFLHAVESVHGEIDKLLKLCSKYENIRYLEDKDEIKLNNVSYG